MITTCDPINPYTVNGTFGVPYNGGYKPDPSLQWIPPDTNVVDDGPADDFVHPPTLPPPNMLMQTCEGKRMDPRVEIKGYKLEYDDFTETQPIEVVKPFESVPQKKTEDNEWRLLTILVILVALIWLITRFS